jgi:hypothetical protein
VLSAAQCYCAAAAVALGDRSEIDRTVVITIGGFGPRTRGLVLEAIAHYVSRRLCLYPVDPPPDKPSNSIDRVFDRKPSFAARNTLAAHAPYLPFAVPVGSGSVA